MWAVSMRQPTCYYSYKKIDNSDRTIVDFYKQKCDNNVNGRDAQKFFYRRKKT